MQHPRGVAVIVGLGIALGVFVVLVVGVVYYGARNQTTPVNQSQAANANIGSVVKLDCTQDNECAAYCGFDSCYTPFCDGTKHCSCSYSCDPVPSGNASAEVADFTSCAAAGNAVQESYPRKCSAGGVTFTEVIVNSNVNAAKNTNQSTNANVSTAGWKTYTNSDFGYTIKYPSDWPIEPQNTAIKSVVTIGSTPVEPSAGPFGVYVKKNDADLTAFLSSYKQGFPDGCTADKQTTVNGVTWTEVNCTEAFAGQTKKSYQLTRNGSIYQLYYIEGSTSINSTFQLIFSTFTFTK